MKTSLILSAFCVGLTGCASVDFNKLVPRSTAPNRAAPYGGQSTLPPPPPSDAVTVDEFDTASEEDKVAAIAPAAAPSGALGTSIASLGDPTTPGFWVETSLVSSETSGRVMSKATGRTVKVTLKPASGGGSRISLSALQLLDLDLSGLHELVIYGS